MLNLLLKFDFEMVKFLEIVEWKEINDQLWDEVFDVMDELFLRFVKWFCLVFENVEVDGIVQGICNIFFNL